MKPGYEKVSGDAEIVDNYGEAKRSESMWGSQGMIGILGSQ